MPVARTRLAVALASLATLGLELALMRALSLRYWHHFAYMVISVALLGFGTSGTLATLGRRVLLKRPGPWAFVLALGLALSIPVTIRLTEQVDLHVVMLAWDLSQLTAVAAMEALLLIPFSFAGGLLAVVMMDRPERVPGHYAANLIGSGLGAAGSVALMYLLDTPALMTAMTLTALAAAAMLIPGRRVAGWVAAGAVASGIAGVTWLWPYQPGISQFKMLPQVLATPDSRALHRTSGPLGRIDVVSGPAIHYAPALSLSYNREPPDHVLLIADGDRTGAVYDCRRREDWVFMDHTTSAVAYHVQTGPRVLIVGAGGGTSAWRGPIVALEMNGQVIDLMTGPLADRGGGIYRAPGVDVVCREARGYLAGRRAGQFDIIQLTAVDAFGASGAGLQAASESYLYTVESLQSMLDHLSDDGVICVTRWIHRPAREGLRVFDTAAEALRRGGVDPADHLVMIRSWITTTTLVFKRPPGAEQIDRVRRFCERRSFDLGWYKGMPSEQANRKHELPSPEFFEGAGELLGADRRGYLDRHVFDVRYTTDDRPYFYHFFRWETLSAVTEQLGGQTPAYLETGYLMLVAALAQSVVLAAVLILLPVATRLRDVKRSRRKPAVGGYFLLLGVGFMLLEMGFLQRFILYLAHPIYSASAVIASFLVFGGLGSALSLRWSAPPSRVATVAGAVVAGLATVYLLALDGWLGLTQSWALPVRFVIACITVGPLAVAMGHLFPAGLRRLGGGATALVPWALAINGFASVAATVGAPVLAMQIGFTRVTVLAVLCYGFASLLARRLP